MGIILIPALSICVTLLIVALFTSGVFKAGRGMQNKYLLGLLGLIFAIIELFVIYIVFVGFNNEVYGFTLIFNVFFTSIGLSLLAIILSFIKNDVVEKINNVLVISIVFLLILSVFGAGSYVEVLLGITTHY